MTRPWVKYLLIASLALNLLMVGTLAGAALRARQALGGSGNVFGYIDRLPKERRDVLHSRAGELRPALRQMREQVRQAARDRTAAMLAEPFDKPRYIEAQSKYIEAETKLRLLMRDAVAEIAGTMSLEERRAFLHWRGARRMLGEGGDEMPKRR
jgi:uncharacterized membrane protein